MGFFTTVYLMLLLTGVAIYVLAKKAAQHPEAAGGVAKFLFTVFAKK